MEQIAYQVITDRIVKKLEEGTIPWKRPWNGGGWPRNLITGIKYRGINPVILSCAGFASSQWVTFRQLSGIGGKVRKGETASPVIFWNWTEKEDPETGKKKKIPFLKYYNVFNVEQCEGLEDQIEKLTENPDTEPLPECESVVTTYLSRENTLTLRHGENRAYYNATRDLINMPEFKRFISREEYSATLYHEMIHSTGHKARLDRGLNRTGSYGAEDYSKEELIAELGAAFLCGLTGIAPRVLDNAASYIQGWLKALRDDRTLLVSAGGKAQHAVDFILKGKPETQPEA